jgi:arginyl-tRNA synthetase
MQTVISQLDRAFREAIRQAFELEADPLLAPAQNEQFGDYQSNVAMGLAKQVSARTGQKANPRQVAEQIKSKLSLGEMASEVSIAGPGFINVRLSPAWLSQYLDQAIQDPRVGIDPATNPQTVVVDYSGPNIAKEAQVWHLRSTIIGDAIARTLGFLGHRVIRQNHVGDWGLQMGMVTYALETMLGDEELSLAALERMYKQISKASQDPAMRRQMAERTRELQQTPKDQLTGWKRVRELTLNTAHETNRRLGVLLTPEDVRGESDYSDEYPGLVKELVEAGHAKETEGAIGIFPPGFTNQEGDPRPFIIQSRDGTSQYPTFDLAAIRYRVKVLKAQRVIYTHDARQAEHFAMLFAVAKLIGLDRGTQGEVQFEYAPFGTMLGEDGKPYKSRGSESLRLTDLIDEAEERALAVVNVKNAELPEDQKKSVAHAVGIGAVKYFDLSKDRVSDYVLSWDRMLSLEGNTAPYMLYAYARTRSILRKAAAQNAMPGKLSLDAPHELALAKQILKVPLVVDLVARELKPHHLCNYLYELATRFSGFYENCPVLQSEGAVRESRLALCLLTANALALGLDLLGIEHPEQM